MMQDSVTHWCVCYLADRLPSKLSIWQLVAHRIDRQTNLVKDCPTHNQLCDKWNGECLANLVAQEQIELRLLNEGGRERFRGSLLFQDKVAKESCLVNGDA